MLDLQIRDPWIPGNKCSRHPKQINCGYWKREITRDIHNEREMITRLWRDHRLLMDWRWRTILTSLLMDPQTLKCLQTETNQSLKLKPTCTRQYEDLAKTYKNIVNFGRDFNKFSLKDTDLVLSMVIHILTAEQNLRLMQAERNKMILILSERVKPTPISATQ